MTDTSTAALPPLAVTLTNARVRAGLTAAELDYGLAFPGVDTGEGEAPGSAADAYTTELYGLAAADHPEDDPAIADLIGRAREIRDHYRPALDAHLAAAREVGFTGWSRASRARGKRIGYAR